MISLPDRASIMGVLDQCLEARLRALLQRRIDHLSQEMAGELLDLTHILVVEQGDTEADVLREVGFTPLTNPLDGERYGSATFVPPWDWLARHDGWFEMIIAVGDSGFAYVLFIQDVDGVDTELLSLLSTTVQS